MIDFELKHPRMTHEALGFLPHFLSEANPEKAAKQIDANYQHGGGWNSFKGFTMTERGLEYPGDPPIVLLAEAQLRDETIRLYQHAWVAIVQPDGSFDVARID